MASRNIKGITIEINGETTKLEKALKNVDNVVYKTNSELKNLNSALRLDPKNTELLSQKYELLKKNIDESKKRLDTLKEAQRQMGDYNSLTEEQKENYRALSVEIAKSESALKNLTSQYKEFGSVGVQKLSAAGKEVKEFGDNVSDVGKKIAPASAGLIAIGVAGAKAAGDLEQSLGGAEAVFKNYYKNIVEEAETSASKMGTSTNTYLEFANKIGSLMQGAGVDIKTTYDLTTKAMQRAADVASIMGISTSDAMEAITGAAKGNFTMMDNLGVAMNATTLQSYALSKGIDKTYSSMSNAEKVQLAYNMFLEQTADYAGNYEKENKTLNGSLTTMKANLQNLTTELGEKLIPIANKIVTGLLKIIDWFSNLSDGTKNFILIIGGIIAVAGPLLIFVGKIISAVGTIMTILPALGGVITFLTGPIGIAIAAVVAVIAIVTTLYNKCEWFRNGVNAIINFLKNLFVGIIDFVKNNWQALLLMLVNPFAGAFKLLYDNCDGFRNFIDNFVKKIKNFFVNLGDGIKNAVTGMINTIASLPGKIAAIPGKIVSFFASLPSSMLSIGKNVVSGIWSGISSSYEWIKSKITGWVGNVVKFIKKLFGIHSPSKVMKEQIGENLGLGIVEGIDDTVSDVENAMKGLNSKVQASVNPIINPNAISNQLSDNSALSNIFSIDYKKLASAMVEEMSKVKIELDDEVAGKFVKKTVAAEIYS